MKRVNLDLLEINEFYLGKNKFKYQFKQEDKKYYILSVLSLNSQEDNTKKMIEIFTNILKKQNIFINITSNDLVGLLHFFNYILL